MFKHLVINLITTISFLSCFTHVLAEGLTVTATDSSGKPVSNVVVSAYSTASVPQRRPATDQPIIIDQVDKTFVNHVTPVQTGTAVSFPNHDQIRHHVYSFSPAKTFEIPLYKGIPADPIVFKQEGVVTLGCNIHDWMSAYIVVVNTPYFAKTDQQGKLSLSIPEGDYQLHFWHRDADQQTKNRKQLITISPGENASLAVQLSLKAAGFSGRSPISIFNRGRYR